MEAAAILAGIQLIETLIPYIQKQIATAKQKGELTPEMETALDARIEAITSGVYWQPQDPPQP